MNAALQSVVPTESPARASLRARRERLQAIEREAAPLRGQLHALEINVRAAEDHEVAATIALQAALAAFNDAVAAAPTAPHRDLETAWAARRSDVERLGLRVNALRNASKAVAESIRKIDAGAAVETQPLLALQHALAMERMTAAVDRRNEIKADLAAAEQELDAFALAADSIARDCEHAHGLKFAFLAPGLRTVRVQELNRARNAELIARSLPALGERVAEIRAEVEAA
jgi:hypothetical protein